MGGLEVDQKEEYPSFPDSWEMTRYSIYLAAKDKPIDTLKSLSHQLCSNCGVQRTLSKVPYQSRQGWLPWWLPRALSILPIKDDWNG